MEKDNKIQYKILKSEACGHVIEYKMVKKEHELEKARIDEGLSPREKMKAREARSSKEREPKELNPDQYETGKKIARTKAVTATGEKQRKETLKDVLHTHKQNIPKSPSKEDLEYPMAASEEECKCEDKTEKCECEDKEMKKREKFYIHKIQELRKKQLNLPGFDPLADRPIKEIPGAILDTVKSKAGNFASKTKDAATRFGNLTPSQLGQGIKNAATGAVGNAGQGIKNAATGALANAGQGIKNAATGALANTGQGIKNAATKLGPLARFATGPIGAAAMALNPSEIGQSADDKKFIQQQMGAAGRNKENQQYGGKNAGQYVLQNAPEGSQRGFQEKSNTGMKQALGMPTNQSSTVQSSNTEAATAPKAQTPAAQKYDMKNPFKVENAKNFKDAFNQARKETGGGGNVFEYGGKKYHTYTQDEFKNPEKSGIPTDNKFYKDWQAKKDVTGPGAYYANKMNPTTAPAAQTTAPVAQTPAAQTPAAQTPAAQTPAAQTPAAQTPAAQTPAAQTPASTGYTKNNVGFGGMVQRNPTNISDVSTTQLMNTTSPDFKYNPSIKDTRKFSTGRTIDVPSRRGLIQTDSSVKSPETGYIDKKNMG